MTPWLNRNLHFLDYAVGALWRRKWKNASLLVVYTVLVCLLASIFLYSGALRREADLLLQDTPEIIVQHMLVGRHRPIEASVIPAISEIRGVRSVLGRLWGYFFDATIGANYTVMVSAESPVGTGKVKIGRGISRARGVAVGDVLSFRSDTGELLHLAVTDIFQRESELVTSDLMLISRQDYLQLFQTPAGYFTDLAVHVSNPREVTIVAQKIQAAFPWSRVLRAEDIRRTYHRLYDWKSGMVYLMIVGALFGFVIFAWDRAAGLSENERREIGTLKAVGWETAEIIKVKVFEGLIISLSAFLGGFVLAYAHVFFGSSFLFTEFFKGWSVLYPDFSLTPYIDEVQVGTLFLLTVLPYSLATIVPIWRSATTDPAQTLRGE